MSECNHKIVERKSMKKIVMIAKVKNESDIIEMFLRYHCSIFDNILIIDNGSLDGTYEIINYLIEEGLPIELIDEASSEFDPFKFANKYTAEFVRKHDADFVIFMDADEFIFEVNGENVRNEIEKLSDNTIHYLNWRTYVYKNKVDGMFSFNEYKYYRAENFETFTKVIIPGEMICTQNVIVAEGNHSAKVINGNDSNYIYNLRFAHFPIRGKVQYTKQIILNSINMLSYPDYGIQTGAHWKKMYDILEDDVDLETKSLEYAYYVGNHVLEGKLDIDIETKYDELSCNDLQILLLRYTEIMALKLKSERLKNVQYSDGRIRVLVFGTGGLCKKMMPRLNPNKYEVVAFVNSNKENQFTTFRNHIVISPEKMRFFEFDMLIIASEKYFDEMLNIVRSLLPYVSEDRIVDIESLVVNDYRHCK